MKKLLLLTILLSSGIVVFSQALNEKLIPVTTNSKSALSYYNEGMKYFYDVKLDKALEYLKKAHDADPDFFMANYQLAFFYLMNRSGDFEEYADAAINSKSKLSEAEELLKDALGKLKQGVTNVTDLRDKLLQMYPGDPDSYNNMIYFQSLAGDSTGMLETLNKAIKIVPEPAPFYNQLGYVYLTMKQTDKAEKAFDKYIELDPSNPNVYDSKGDYFMYVEQYDRAYESYLKANSMDKSFSLEKANMAKQLYEQKEGKKLEIITI